MAGRVLLRALLPALAILAGAAPAAAQRIVASPRADSVDVTVYRDDTRAAGTALNARFLGGYALISETRRISLPAGESEIRFEGVAAGMVPQSAIVTGFPDGIVERNRDAYLLSPGTLVDRSLGRRVTVRRTSLETGRVRESEAVIRTGAEGAVVLETADGFEALRCTGIPETLEYARIPPGLSARPTLSVRARAARAVTATVTLSYIATGFDWQANYIATLSDDGTHADLFAWLTLASNDETSFPNADTQAVAGHVNRSRVAVQPAEGPPLRLRCWPSARTSDIPLQEFTRTPLSPRLREMEGFAGGEEIMVTGSRMPVPVMSAPAPIAVMTAEEFDLGAVKLYRIPEPVTIAARSQKQVALLHREAVPVTIVHRLHFYRYQAQYNPQATQRILVARNRREEGLGLSLPAGQLVLFAQGSDRPMLIGQGMIEDRAVGEDVEIPLGAAPGVIAERRLVGMPGNGEYEIVVTNDGPQPIRFEAELDGHDVAQPTADFLRRDGMSVLAITVPANDSRTIRYRIR